MTDPKILNSDLGRKIHVSLKKDKICENPECDNVIKNAYSSRIYCDECKYQNGLARRRAYSEKRRNLKKIEAFGL